MKKQKDKQANKNRKIERKVIRRMKTQDRMIDFIKKLEKKAGLDACMRLRAKFDIEYLSETNNHKLFAYKESLLEEIKKLFTDGKLKFPSNEKLKDELYER